MARDPDKKPAPEPTAEDQADLRNEAVNQPELESEESLRDELEELEELEPLVDPADFAFDLETDTDATLSQDAALADAQQRVLRLQAELENFRKRTRRTMDEERRYACLPLMRDLLTVCDNLDRAIEAAETGDSTTGLLEGVKMVAQQLTGVLRQHNCEPIEADGQVFDPHLHEAIAQFPSDEHEPGTVSQVTQAGYQLHDRVVRPSQVIVAAAKPETK